LLQIIVIVDVFKHQSNIMQLRKKYFQI